MRYPHAATVIRGSAFTVSEWAKRHGDALAVLLIGASLLTSGYLIAARELTRTRLEVISAKPVQVSTTGSATTASTGQPINLNTASLAQLDTLPRVGPKLAQKILDYRTAHGSFHSVSELDAVAGIGPAMLAKLTPLVTAP